MTVTDYQSALAAQLEAASTPNNPLVIQKAIPGDKMWVLTINKDCSLVIGPPEQVTHVMAIRASHLSQLQKSEASSDASQWIPAATYSPGPLPAKYHRRRRA